MYSNEPSPSIRRWLAGPLGLDVSRSIERIAASKDVQHVAVMPDVHLSGEVCVGLAVATTRLIYPAAVGGDIGCGMAFLWDDSPQGRGYLSDVSWARGYAQQNRLAMVAAVADLLEDLFGVLLDEDSLIQSDHNHVRCETHFGRPFWVHRKGAQSAREGEEGIVPGSMGTASFHVVGRGCADSLASSSHGAGRRLSRTEALPTISTRQLRREMGTIWFDQRHADSLRDEAPGAYRDIRTVMRAQGELVRIVRELRPLLSYKGR